MTASTYLNEASNSPMRQVPLDFTHQVDLYAANQLHRLEKQINRRLETLLQHEAKLIRLEEELAYFTESYFTEVGTLCDEISELEEALEGQALQMEVQIKPWEWRKQRQVALRDEASRKERKALYRRLVKDAHPDAHSQADTKAFMRIQKAYETGHMAALWQVEWEQLQRQTRQCEPLERMQKLLSWFQRLERYAQEMQQRYVKLQQSDTGQLMERYMEARLAGRDWMGQMKQQLQGQAEQLKYRLVNQRLQALVKG